jgi:hypothetical protein
MKNMAANEFEKNVRNEMDEFKLRPSEEVWPKIEERIREKNRKRRVLFFILFSSIALMLAGYGVYKFSGNNTRSEAQHKLSEGSRPNDENKTGNSKNEEHNKETIAIKPNLPAENNKQANKSFIVTRQKQVTQSGKDDKHVTLSPKRNSASQKRDLAALNINEKEQKNDISSDSIMRENTRISFSNQQPIITGNNQNEIAKQGDKNLTLGDTTGSKLTVPKDTRSVQAVSKKKGDKVRGKITWGINFSAGSSVITEDAFSFKSSYARADRAYASPPGSSTGGGPLTGGGGSITYSRYPQSQNKPAFAFKAGINARKNISKRSSLSAGLGYSYLADKIKVGAAQGGSQSQSAFSSSYYTGAPQQTYTDHFHFIELPLSYNWRVTNNTDRFLSLNAGVSPSYLLATNTLLYDTVAGGIYYHNKDLVTRVHLNFTSGISYQFKNKKSLEFSIGPQFSFDVSEAFKSDLDKRKYFLYTGIDARVFFETKKK